MSFITSPGIIVPPLTAGAAAYGTGSQAKMNSAGTVGQVLTSAGAGVPIWTTPTAVNYPITVPLGGTGLTALTANNVILGNGASAPTFVAPGTSGNVLTSSGSTWASAAGGGLTLGTPVATTSGTSVTFTGIPSNAKIVYVNFNDFSAGYAGTNNQILVQIGTSGGIEITGYQSFSACISATGSNAVSTAYSIRTASFTRSLSGTIVINLESIANNSWICSGLIGAYGDNFISTVAARKNLSGILTQLQISVDGGYSFTGGEINISYGT